MTWMETYTGKQFVIMHPTEDMLDIKDIAHSLSMQCRYNGHCQKFYSVAEHCCILHDYVVDNYFTEKNGVYDSCPNYKLAFEILLHDASEAYLCDIPRPLKVCLPDYSKYEKTIEALIAKKYGLTYPHQDIIKELDSRILLDERRLNMSDSGHDWEIKMDPLNIKIHNWLPKRAYREYLYRFNDYWKYIK